MTTFDLRDYRHQLERAIAFLDGKDPVPRARAVLRARLDAVLAEQDEQIEEADLDVLLAQLPSGAERAG